MSVKVSSRVWEESRQDGSHLLLLLAIADHTDDYGVAWPGIPRLQKKIRRKRRQTQYLIRDLEETGELFVAVNNGRGNSNRYFITIGWDRDQIVTILTKHEELNYTPLEAEAIANKIIKKREEKGAEKCTDSDDDEDASEEEKGAVFDEKGAISNQKRCNHAAPESFNHQEPSTDEAPALLDGKADTSNPTDLPNAESQAPVLFGGRTDTYGSDVIAIAEMDLMRSGWKIRSQSVKNKIVYLLAATGWSVPTTNSERADWYKSIRDDHAKWRDTEVFDLYRSAFRRLAKRVLEGNGNFSFSPRPGSLTKTIEAILEERRIKQGNFSDLLGTPENVRIREDGKKVLIVK